MKDSTVLWNCNLSRRFAIATWGHCSSEPRRFANRHSENLQMIKANLSWHPSNHFWRMTLTVWCDFVESHVIVDRHPHNRSCRWWQRGKVAFQCDRLCNAQTFIDTIVSQKSPSLSYSYNGGTSCALFHGCSPLQAARLLQALDSGLSMVTHSVRCHFAMTDNNIYYELWLLFLIYP